MLTAILESAHLWLSPWAEVTMTSLKLAGPKYKSCRLCLPWLVVAAVEPHTWPPPPPWTGALTITFESQWFLLDGMILPSTWQIYVLVQQVGHKPWYTGWYLHEGVLHSCECIKKAARECSNKCTCNVSFGPVCLGSECELSADVNVTNGAANVWVSPRSSGREVAVVPIPQQCCSTGLLASYRIGKGPCTSWYAYVHVCSF